VTTEHFSIHVCFTFFQYWRFKVKDSDSTSKDDDVGEVILEIDPFVKANVPKDLKLQSENGDIGAILTITLL
jgi:hypothetical protein